MTFYLKWLGIDFGQCMTDPRGLRNPLLFNDIMKELGRPGETNEKIHRYRRLKEKYSGYAPIKEGHKDEILRFVFDGDEEAMEIFNRKELEEVTWAEGVEQALIYLRSEGVECDIVSELKKTLGPIGADVVTGLLDKKGLSKYLGYFYSPQGKLKLKDRTVDFGPRGKDKGSGELWDYVLNDLKTRGIRVEEAGVIGDKLTTDIEPPGKRGFHTIQFTGYIDMGRSEYAEYRVKSFQELTTLIKGLGENR